MSKLLWRLFPLLLAGGAAACDPPVPAASSTSAAPSPAPPPVSALVSGSPTGSESNAVSAAAAPQASADDVKSLAHSNNAFALDFYAKARAGKGNLALSPFSISTALAMTWAGAKGETAEQMRKVLHLEGPSDRVLNAAGALVAGYGAPGQKVTVRIANRLFGEKSFTFEPPYLARVKAAFGAPLETLDFVNAAPAARGRINDWVAKETQDRIKDLIPASAITAQTRLVLTNAIYFLGDWAMPFTKESTSPQPFSITKTETKPVPTMHEVKELHYAATDGVKLVELPYDTGALAMTLVLPDAVDGLDAVEARLTPAAMEGWLAAAKETRVAVALPKLEIAPADALALGPILASMGMPLAFDTARADFTGMANPPNPTDRLAISQVFHKAFVKVDEKGTEAAAATAVIMTPRAMMVSAKPAEFKADHPFLFFLRDVRSGMILFMGRVSDASSK
jgi:serpin B